MPRNLMVCGLEFGIMPKVLMKLHNDHVINITEWLYDGNVSDVVVAKLSYARERTTLWRGAWQIRKSNCPDCVSKAIAENMDWLMQEFARDTEFYREPFYEIKNLIYHMAREIYNDLVERSVECVLFPDVPHGDINALVYVVARSLEITTKYIVPSYDIYGKFMYADTIEQYGDYKSLPVYDKKEKIHIEKQYEKSLSYMDETQIKQDRGEDWGRRLELLYKPRKWLNKKIKVIKKTTDKYDDIDDFCERKLIRFISSKQRKNRYNKNVDNISRKEVDFSKKYVYFPLHLQPEMTADTIGGIYRDQLLAVERVRSIIPPDWYIYVKENPKQLPNNTRGKFFFKRMQSIDKVIFFDRKVDTYELLRNSQFVATVTGTVGWEAISGGKAVLTFGKSWYRQLPGVVNYHRDVEWEHIVKCKWTHEDLEKEYAMLVSTMCDGAWLDDIIAEIKDFDYNANLLNLYESMRFVLTNFKE